MYGDRHQVSKSCMLRTVSFLHKKARYRYLTVGTIACLALSIGIYIPSVLRIRDVFSGSWIRIFYPAPPRIQGRKDSGSRIRIHNKEFQVFLTQKTVSKVSEKFGSSFFSSRIPDPGVKKSYSRIGTLLVVLYCLGRFFFFRLGGRGDFRQKVHNWDELILVKFFLLLLL
jgi:hypothetical protein